MSIQIDYNLYAVDLPSHANSDAFPDLSLELYIEILHELVKSIDSNHVILCGHALGGAIALSYYFKYSEKIRALILIDTGAKLRVSQFILNTVKNNYQEFLDSLAVGIFYRKTSAEIINKYVEQSKNIKPEVAQADFSICNTFDVMDKIRSINVPTLIICGKDDKIAPIKYSTFFDQNIEDSKLVIIRKASHMVILEKPEEVNDSIIDFLKSV